SVFHGERKPAANTDRKGNTGKTGWPVPGAPAALSPERLMRWRQPAAGVELGRCHQTLAGRPETLRGSAETGGCAATVWRSGADD
ncbi:hypothetical protein, partial [Yersinia pekkanenii]|uniref:hypothetical protein n=1 Tax=Yersinia pekkanenii TaxID=1288385 RepID=UPI00066FFF42